MNVNEEKEEVLIVRVTLYEYLIFSALLIHVLEFLNLRGLGIVDSANTNVKWRPQYLMRLHQMTHSLFRSIQPNEAHIKWVIKRRIKVEEMMFKMYENEPADSWFVDSGDVSQLGARDASLSQLHTINLAGCNNITYASLIELSKGCPLLQVIDLGSCENITDASIIGLSKGCPLLHKIDITDNNNITYRSIIKLIEGCILLSRINRSGCEKIMICTLKRLALKRPRLKIT